MARIDRNRQQGRRTVDRRYRTRSRGSRYVLTKHRDAVGDGLAFALLVLVTGGLVALAGVGIAVLLYLVGVVT